MENFNHAWETLNELLTKKIMALSVSGFAVLNGVKSMEMQEVMGWLGLTSLLLGIVAAILTIRSLLTRQRLMNMQMENESAELKKRQQLMNLRIDIETQKAERASKDLDSRRSTDKESQ